MIDVDLEFPVVTEAILPPPRMTICLLGEFRVLEGQRSLLSRRSGKTEALLYRLALARGFRVTREALTHALWPDVDLTLAGSALNSLIYSLQKRFGPLLMGTTPVLYRDGAYRLHIEAGIGIDVIQFDALAAAGDRHSHAGHTSAALRDYTEALALYRGDLYVPDNDVQAVIERERLRTRYQSILAHVARHYLAAGDHRTCLDAAQRLVSSEPCREDVHRLIMRCYVLQRQRAAALRQYRLCEDLLRAEFDAVPEPATTALFEQIRCDPVSIRR